MDKSIIKIDCNDRKRRILLRLCGFTFPIWGPIFSALMFSAAASNSFPPDAETVSRAYIAAAGFFLGFIGSWTLLRSRLKIDKNSIFFPGILGRGYALSDLQELSADQSYLSFHFAASGSKNKKKPRVVKLALQRMDRSERNRLVEFLQEKCGNCVLSEESRRVLDETDSGVSFSASEKTVVRIPYDSHKKTKAFYDVCLQYERMFWTVWIICCAPFALMLLPMLLVTPAILFLRLTGHPYPYELYSFFTPWINLWQPIMAPFLENVGKPVESWRNFLSGNPACSFLVNAIAIWVVFKCLSLLAKPTGVILTKKGLQFDYGSLFVRTRILQFRWQDLKRVELVSASRGKVSEQSLRFLSADNVSTVLNLSALSKKGSRLLLKKAIEFWAPQAELDASFAESAEQVQRQSYTELWLQSLNAPPRRDRLTPLEKGNKLKGGDITILETIGAGGQGVAYLAESKSADGETEQIVVKEFVLPVYVDRRARLQALERFEKEARLLASFRNEHIVGLKDHFVEDHRAYLVLEHVKGKSLRKICRECGPLDENALQNLCRQMCEILAHLHGQEPPMVHRDFTPDNLLIDDSGKLTLIDFNVAHQVSNDAKATVVGKHAYMPPEQFAGRPRPQSDIYAMGATLYFALCGNDPEPFSQSGLPPSCLEVNPLWGEIIAGCTALDTAQRFKTSAEVLQILGKTACTSASGENEGERIELTQPEAIS